MRKYIDAEELKTFMRTTLTGNDLYTPNGIDEFVDGLPVADVVKRVYRGRRPSDDLVKVVRCKECKHANLFYPYCTIWEAAIDGDGFCYKGEKE